MSTREEHDQLSGKDYRVRRLDVMEQFHIVRRLGPLLANMGVTGAQLQGFATGKFTQDDVMALILPAIATTAAMTNDDANYIIYRCMEAVDRKEGDAYSPVYVGGRWMYQDIELPSVLWLAFCVLRHNLQGFSQGLRAVISSLEVSAPKTASQTST